MIEHRKSERFYHESPVVLEDHRTGFKFNGTMQNYSQSGMYFLSDYAPRPDRKINITVDHLPSNSAPQTFRAQIKWRRLLNHNSAYNYGIGVQYD
jgi:hypothetical protein